MSFAAAQQQAHSPQAGPPTIERCPLCGAAIGPVQEWCLRCGAAARTRLAATPGWRTPVLVLATVIVISLGVIVASLVKLVG